MKHILAVLFLSVFAQCSFAATATQSERLEFQTTGNDCYADGSPVMDGECYALVWKKTGATFPGFEMIPQAPNDLSKLNDDVWLLDYFPIAVKGELAEIPWSSCPTYTLYLGWLPADKATNGTVTVYLLDTRYTKADGTTACGFDSDAGEDRPRRINAYTPISGLTDITVKLSMSPVVGKNVTGGSYETPTVANQATEEVKFQIAFNAAGGICDEPSREVVYGNPYGELPKATLAGYTFVGWFTAATGGAMVTAATVATSNATLFAQWTPNDNTVAFDGNGGTPDEASRTVKTDAKLGELPSATLRGYTLAGWFTDREKGEKVSADTVIKSNVTYYAQWTANEYTVDFDPRGGSGTMDPQPMTWDEEAALVSNLYARVGYTFLGWTDDETELEEVLYYDGVVVSNLTDVAGGEYDLYAVWAANSYTVSFDANGGVGDKIEDLECFYDTVYQLPKNCFSREGYGFAGWTNATSVAVYADGSSVSNLTAEAGGKVVMFATWQAGSNTVNFDANGGKGLEVLSRSVKTGEKLGELPMPVRENYTFSGWFTEREDGELVTADTIVTADMTIFAHWTPIVYTITYNLEGGVNAAENPASYTVETPDITLAAPTRKGFVFKGWEPEGTIASGSTGDKTFTAKWEAEALPSLFDEPTVGPISEKGATYNGFLGDEEFGGTFTLVVKKLKKGQTFADATLTRVNPATGKKEKVIGKVDAATGEGAEGLEGLQLNAQGVGGTLDGVRVQGAVDAAKAKNADALTVMTGFNKNIYGLVFENAEQEKAYLTIAFSTKGKAKVAGSYRGAKVSGSAQMSVGSGRCAVPFAWSKKGDSVSFVLWFDRLTQELVDVTGLGAGASLVDAGPAGGQATTYAGFALDEKVVRESVSDAIAETFRPIDILFDGKKFDAGKAAKVSYKNDKLSVLGDNVTGLKLTYSKGALKGSFTVYAVTNGKLVKNKFAVSGVMVDGEIHAVGTKKNLTPIPVMMKK